MRSVTQCRDPFCLLNLPRASCQDSTFTNGAFHRILYVHLPLHLGLKHHFKGYCIMFCFLASWSTPVIHFPSFSDMCYHEARLSSTLKRFAFSGYVLSLKSRGVVFIPLFYLIIQRQSRLLRGRSHPIMKPCPSPGTETKMEMFSYLSAHKWYHTTHPVQALRGTCFLCSVSTPLPISWLLLIWMDLNIWCEHKNGMCALA